MPEAFDRVSRPPVGAILPFRLHKGRHAKVPTLHLSPLSSGFSHENRGILAGPTTHSNPNFIKPVLPKLRVPSDLTNGLLGHEAWR